MPARPRILVVDDEEDILLALKSYLEGALDADVAVAATGAQGLAILRSEPPIELIVSDYRMPGMNGIEFLRKARQEKPDVPRLLLTAFPDMGLAIQAVNEAAILQFLTKPVQPEKLLELVRTMLAEARRKRLGKQAVGQAPEALGKRRQD